MIKTFLSNEREVHVHYVAIDDLLITTPLKNDITALWSCSGRAGASLLGQDVVASLQSLCMANLNDCANGDEADFTYVQTQKTQSLYCHESPDPSIPLASIKLKKSLLMFS